MAKKSIMFSLRDDAPIKELQTVISEIQKWEGVQAAGILFPDTADAKLQRMGYVELRDAANPQKLIQQVSSLSPVEKASLAAERSVQLLASIS